MRILVALALAVLGLGRDVHAQGFPNRVVTIVVPFPAGGPSDAMARLLAPALGEQLGQRAIVDNVPGAGGTIGSAKVARAAPDGHTLVFGNIGTHAANVGLYKSLPYDPAADFEPVALLASVPFLLVARPTLAASDVAGFRALLARERSTLNYGSAGVGSASHLACLLLNATLGGEAQHVPYRGVGPAMNDLVAGQIDFMCDQTITTVPQVQAGAVKPIGVMSAGRVAAVPSLPTLAESGVSQFDVQAWSALFAPKGTPRDVVQRLFEATFAAQDGVAVRPRLEALGAVLPTRAAAEPAALRAHVAAEIAKWVPVIRAAGVTAE